MAELLNNLGVLDWRRGRLAEAGASFDEALTLWRAVPSANGAAATLTNQGNVFFESGAYQQALDRFHAAQMVFDEHHDQRGEAYALNNIGVTRQALGDLDGALTFLGRAATAFRAAGEVAAEGRARLRLGRVRVTRGEREHAAAAIAEGLTLIRRAGDRLGEGDATDLSGVAAAAAGDTSQALAHYEQARAQYEEVGSRKGEATALHHAGDALVSLNRPSEAIARFALALDIRRQVGLRDAEAETRYGLARAERQLGRLAQAREHLRAALETTEDVRGRVAGEYSRLTYFSSRQSYFGEQIDVLMELHERQPDRGYAVEAFETSERQRARSLLDEIEGMHSAPWRGVEPSLLVDELALRRQLDFWAYRLAGLANRRGADAEIAEARRVLGERVDEYRGLEARVRAASRESGMLASSPVLGVRELQRQILDVDTVLLRVSLGERRSFAWLLTQDSLRTAILPDRATIDRAARRVREVLRAPRYAGASIDVSATMDTAIDELSAMLLAPLATKLKQRRLLIVSDGILQTVPFAALREPGTGEPLIVRHEVVMLPSATTLAALGRQVAKRTRAPKAVAVLADPVYDPGDGRIPHGHPALLVAGSTPAHGDSPHDAGPFARWPLTLNRLPFSGMEARWIADLVPSSSDRFVATGLAATRHAATNGALRDYRIVHFAAHALLDDDHPEVSGIALSLFDEHGAAQDGLLRLHDIRERLDLRADLVVISACETALGRDVPGEGLMGLARGFFGAGAARVVASLHRVPDAATAQLMREFYKGMLGSHRLTPAAALRAAQLRMMGEPQWSDPYYWGAFVLLGDPR